MGWKIFECSGDDLAKHLSTNITIVTYFFLSGELKVAALNGAELKECDSESSSSSLCMTAADSWDGASCHGEMMAGHGLMCRSTGSDTWHLVGVSAWRRGCGSVGQRPRWR